MAREARADRRAAVTAWVLAEIHRDRRQQARAFTLEDFLVHHWPGVDTRPAPKPAQTLEEQHRLLTEFFGALGATPEES